MTGFIYKITNKLNGKIYIGKTLSTIEDRWKEHLKESDFHTNTLGRELNRQTITGDADALYKCLMELHAQKHLTDEEFFPSYVKAHIDRGAILLDQEQRYGGNFLVHLTELEKSL